MPYKFLAEIVVAIHFLWIVFLIFGAIPGARWKAVKYLHVSGLAFALFIQTSRSYCPLTRLESFLEVRDSLAAYSGSFIGHYLDKLVYINAPEWTIISLTWLLCAFNAYVYVWRPIARKKRVFATAQPDPDVEPSRPS